MSILKNLEAWDNYIVCVNLLSVSDNDDDCHHNDSHLNHNDQEFLRFRSIKDCTSWKYSLSFHPVSVTLDHSVCLDDTGKPILGGSILAASFFCFSW